MKSFLEFCMESPDPIRDLGLVKLKLHRKDGSSETHSVDPKKSVFDFLAKIKKDEKASSKSPIIGHDLKV